MLSHRVTQRHPAVTPGHVDEAESSRAWGLRDNNPVTARPTPVSSALFERAQAVTPGGVNSPVRAFSAVGGTPRFIRSAKGAWLTDVDGNEYVDLVCSWGPMLLGHAHPEVQAAIAEAVARGTSFGTPTEPEVELAEEIVARTPVEKVRFVSSGTEATMSALRLARGFTGRDVVIKFAGCYHGHVDALLASAGSGLATLAVPGTPGVPASAAGETIVLPYNDRAAVTAAFAEHGDRIACLITEAAPGNMGVVPPAPGFNGFLAQTCRDHGALFISDEVMTGFRATREGGWGLDGAVEGWTPDLMTFGKVMGGGFPAAAFGGRADVMSRLAPEGPVYQAGTLSGNPIATTAGLATLRLATPEVYADLSATAETIKSAVADALTAAGVPHGVQSAGTMFSTFFTRRRGHRLRGRVRRRTRRRSPPSSTPCSTPGSTSRRPRSSRGSSRRPTTSGPSPPSSMPSRARPAPPQRLETHERARRSSTCSATARCTTPRVCSTAAATASTSPSSASRWPTASARPSGTATSCTSRTSPLERAQETAAPLAAARGLTPVLDPRVIESANKFEGINFGGGAKTFLKRPALLRHMYNPLKPSWGEPYDEIAGRMMAAVEDARDAARGHEAVIVSHQLPIWTTRLFLEKRSYLHHPKNRQCTLCSVTSLHFEDDQLRQVVYSEPAGDLIPVGDRSAPFSAGGAKPEDRP